MIFNKQDMVKLPKMSFLWIFKDSNYDNLVYVGNIIQKRLRNWKLSKIKDMQADRTEKTLIMYDGFFIIHNILTTFEKYGKGLTILGFF